MRIKQLFLEFQEFVKCRLMAEAPEATYTLEELLAGSSKESLVLNEEDHYWLNAEPVGKEII